MLSAFLVNDIICLVMVPFALFTTRRMGLKPVPYLLAVATASNIGSVATITGNPQNMLIGSASGLGYRYFLGRLGPVALIGLVLDWLIIRVLCAKDLTSSGPEPDLSDAPDIATHRLHKPAVVIVLVLAGFLAGVPPAMMAAIGAAIMLITRTRDPRLVYDEVDWGLLVFFVGLFVIVGGAENSGLTSDMFDIAQRFNLQNIGIFTAVTAVLSNIVSNVPAVVLLKTLVPQLPRSANRLARAGHGEHACRKPHHHRLSREPDRRRARPRPSTYRFLGLRPCGNTRHTRNTIRGLGVARVDTLTDSGFNCSPSQRGKTRVQRLRD